MNCAIKFDIYGKPFPWNNEKDFNKPDCDKSLSPNYYLYGSNIAILLFLITAVIVLWIKLKNSKECQKNRKNFIKEFSITSNFKFFSCQQNA